MHPADWYYASGADHVGPFTREQIEALVRAGTLGPDTPVRQSDRGEWAPAADAFAAPANSPDVPSTSPVKRTHVPAAQWKPVAAGLGLLGLLALGAWAVFGNHAGDRDGLYVADQAALIGRDLDDVAREFPELKARPDRDGYTDQGDPPRVRSLGYEYTTGPLDAQEIVSADGTGRVFEVHTKMTVPEGYDGDRPDRARELYGYMLGAWTDAEGPPDEFSQEDPPYTLVHPGRIGARWYARPGVSQCLEIGSVLTTSFSLTTTTRSAPC